MKIYIAGPMRGLPELNFEAFDAAAARWKEAGHQPFSPAAIDRALGYSSKDEHSMENLRHVILGDIVAIYSADAIALLPGWSKSRGATLELALAQVLDLPIYDAVTMDLMNPPQCPWHSNPY